MLECERNATLRRIEDVGTRVERAQIYASFGIYESRDLILLSEVVLNFIGVISPVSQIGIFYLKNL